MDITLSEALSGELQRKQKISSSMLFQTLNNQNNLIKALSGLQIVYLGTESWIFLEIIRGIFEKVINFIL